MRSARKRKRCTFWTFLDMSFSSEPRARSGGCRYAVEEAGAEHPSERLLGSGLYIWMPSRGGAPMSVTGCHDVIRCRRGRKHPVFTTPGRNLRSVGTARIPQENSSSRLNFCLAAAATGRDPKREFRAVWERADFGNRREPDTAWKVEVRGPLAAASRVGCRLNTAGRPG